MFRQEILFFFDFDIVSRCFLFRRLGLGLGDACGFSGDRSFFFMVMMLIFGCFYVGFGTGATA